MVDWGVWERADGSEGMRSSFNAVTGILQGHQWSVGLGRCPATPCVENRRQWRGGTLCYASSWVQLYSAIEPTTGLLR